MMQKPLVDFCIATSGGGHLIQILHAVPFLDWKGRSLILVSTSSTIPDKIKSSTNYYLVSEANHQCLWKVLWLNFQCFKIIKRHKPKVVLSTGAAVGFLCCFWGKLFGAKVIWIDSIANTRRLSLSGRMIRPFADLILSQWPEVAKKYPNVEYAGELI